MILSAACTNTSIICRLASLSRYDVARLVWFVHGEDISSAIELEKKIKNRGRQWKVDLIEKTNPNWDDLSADWATPQLRAG